MPEAFEIHRDGRRIGGLDWGGSGPDVLFLHPNGFCAGVFEPLARRLDSEFRLLGIDLCGHGSSDPPASLADLSYAGMVADVLAVLDHLGLSRVQVLGHSLGGGVAVLVDRADPARIGRLLLCEAVVFAEFAPTADRPPMAEIARKRRAVWPDRETMRRSYASREPLCRLDPEALDAYLRHGVTDRPDGQVELACLPEVEGEIFEMTPTSPHGSRAAWAHLPRLRGRAVIASGATTSLPPLFDLQAEVSGCPHVVVAGSHFFPQEELDATAALVRAHLG